MQRTCLPATPDEGRAAYGWKRPSKKSYGGAWDFGPWEFHPLSLLFIASGRTMISKTLRIPKP